MRSLSSEDGTAERAKVERTRASPEIGVHGAHTGAQDEQIKVGRTNGGLKRSEATESKF